MASSSDTFEKYQRQLNIAWETPHHHRTLRNINKSMNLSTATIRYRDTTENPEMPLVLLWRQRAATMHEFINDCQTAI